MLTATNTISAVSRILAIVLVAKMSGFVVLFESSNVKSY